MTITYIQYTVWNKSEDTKGTIRGRTLKKGRQYNGQYKKDKYLSTNNNTLHGKSKIEQHIPPPTPIPPTHT